MRLCFNIELPDSDLRVGELIGHVPGRSDRGYSNRQYKRLFPIILCLRTLVDCNKWFLARMAKEGKTVAPLYESGVYYQAEPAGEEEWLDIPTLYKQGFGDCEDLASARVAELQHMGIPAVTCIKSKKIISPKGGEITLVHVQVLWPDGTVEDPSAILGMKGEY